MRDEIIELIILLKRIVELDEGIQTCRFAMKEATQRGVREQNRSKIIAKISERRKISWTLNNKLKKYYKK